MHMCMVHKVCVPVGTVIYSIQVGDAKEPVRKGVRALFRELCSFYPPGKLFTFVLDGLKSKNARQRTGER